MEWASKVQWGIGPVPELYIEKLQTWNTLHAADEGEEVLPGITAHTMPGHTPGHFIYLLKGKDHDVIFTGDAAKNRAELLSGKADGTYDQAVSSKSIAAIWSLWKARPGNVVIPGHDIPMVLKEGRPEYLAKREAAMKAWFGDDLDTMTTIELAVR
jgi:glyoxylase-like metal-dependent hydrolase (beta-lactamase superfamily II)